MILRCLLAFFLLIARISYGSDNYPVEYLGIERGLSNNAVTCIYQDQQGFMWFGTYDGLNRYDGYNFQVFRNTPGDTSSLIGNSIYTIAGDTKDNLWVGGQKGACLLNAARSGFTWLKYLPANKKTAQWLQDDIHTINAIQKDLVLIGTNHLGLVVFEKESRTGKQILLPGTQSASYDVTAIAGDSASSTIWIFIQQYGLYKYLPATRKLQLINNNIREANSLTCSKDGHVWLGNESGLFEYDPRLNNYTVNRLPGNNKVVHIREDRKGMLWIGSDGGGLLVMKKNEPTARPFATDKGEPMINSNAVYAINE